jgi:hypothetical protein
MAWRLLELEQDPAGTVRAVLVSNGQSIEFVADFELGDRQAIFSGLHVNGGGPNSVGIAGLRNLIRWAMEQLDVDEIRIKGATRTSGAGPGRRPATLFFRRSGTTRPAA